MVAVVPVKKLPIQLI